MPPSKDRFDSPSATKQRGQHGLEHQGRAAGRADAEGVVARPDRAGAENQAPGAQGRPFHFGAADLGCGQHGGQVLPHQARLLSPGADLLDHERPARHQRQGQRRAEDLPAAFALGAVDPQESLLAVMEVYLLIWSRTAGRNHKNAQFSRGLGSLNQ